MFFKQWFWFKRKVGGRDYKTLLLVVMDMFIILIIVLILSYTHISKLSKLHNLSNNWFMYQLGLILYFIFTYHSMNERLFMLFYNTAFKNIGFILDYYGIMKLIHTNKACTTNHLFGISIIKR